MRYDSSWQFNDETHGRWEYNKSVFESRQAFYYWIYKTVKDGYALGNTMGDKSIHGVVYHYTPSYEAKTKKDLFVLKTQRVDQQSLLNQLKLEAGIGMTPNAPVPTVFAHRYNKTTGMYEILMRNVMKDTKVLRNKRFMSMQNFIKNPMLDANERKDAIRKFHDVLVQFYKSTHYFHGDLHLGNIIVTHDANWKIDDIYIIDLGSVVPFPKSLDTRRFRYVSDFMKPMTKAYNSLMNRENFTGFNKNTKHYGNVVWLHSETSVIHNLKQKQNNRFWMDVLAIGQSNTQLTSHPIVSKKKRKSIFNSVFRRLL
jgi:hypothetical protein